MRLAARTKKSKRWLSKGFATVKPWRAGQVLAVGALLAAGAALYFNMTYGGEAGSPSSTPPDTLSSGPLVPLGDDVAESEDNELSKNFVGIPCNGYCDDIAIERLENQIDRMLADAARNPSIITPQLNREIQRLDDQIDMLRLNAIRDTSVGRPTSSEQIGKWPPDTEYYRNPNWREGQMTTYPVACEAGGYVLQHELFGEAWQNLLGRPPSSQPTACEIDQYAVRQELEESLYNETWKEQESR